MSGKRSKKERKSSKEAGIEKKKVYHLTEDQIKHMKDIVAKEAINKATILMLGLPMMALRDSFGFGKDRLSRFVDKTLDLQDSFDQGYITLDDCLSTIKEETGVDILMKVKSDWLF